jgi:hypothetical protein
MKRILCIVMLLILVDGCKKPYNPPVSESVNSILVVEGTIAVGTNAENRFLLSRLRPLQDTSLNDPESGARIIIESQSGQTWTLSEKEAGTYFSTISLPLNVKYRLKVQTRNGHQYETDFLDVIATPPIDSVTWEQPHDVDIFVHTHDPSNNTKYYRWEYTETWEYHAFYDSNLDFVNGQIVFLQPADYTYACYSSESSGSIIINNTTALTEDVISYQPILTLPNPSPKASYKYSVQVRQVGLTEDAYKFWNILRKNTELTGTLFDPQPSQLPGNIRSVTDPSEKVIGFVSAGQVKEKRIFIRNAELPGWPQMPVEDSVCKVVDADPNAIEFLKQDTTYGPAFFVTGGGLRLAKKQCMDCRRRGGTLTRPPFWQ